ncbi:MAG: hypothetical protein U1E27_12150, partial [Kiritimatiellia bacterium]|nr:hypothetical protein [Kiritimatiellia bacterium]
MKKRIACAGMILAACVLGSLVGVAQNADFILTDIRFVEPAVPEIGGSFRLRVTIKNQGDVAGDAGVVHFWPAAPYDTVPAAISIPIGILEPGQTITRSRVLVAPSAPGTYNARGLVVTDTQEKSTGNNHKLLTYTLHAGSVWEPTPGKADF